MGPQLDVGVVPVWSPVGKLLDPHKPPAQSPGPHRWRTVHYGVGTFRGF